MRRVRSPRSGWEGIEKLGIHEDTPAVAAAKYHYHTNIIGGLDMEYCEESDRKAWIRYKAPMWVYDGVGMLAMPGGLRRTVFSAWHPRNGRLMGCPRLGYVGTKFIMEGRGVDGGRCGAMAVVARRRAAHFGSARRHARP